MTKSITLAAFSALILSAAVAQAAPVTVTTGAGYVKMVDALTALYQKETGVVVGKAFGGNIGQMLAQVREGGAVNVVISDRDTLKRFDKNLAAESASLGVTPLVMVWRKGLTLNTPADIAGESVKSVASPDPKAAIYGRAANEWLGANGLTEKLGSRLNTVSTVPQVFSYVATGNMDAGFVNLTAWRSGQDKVGGHFELTGKGAEIHMVVRPVAGFENDPDVRAFTEFLTSGKAKAVLNKFGIR